MTKRATELKEGETFIPGSYDALHPGRFIKAGHLEGKPLTLTIKRFWGEHMGAKRDKKTGENKPDIKGILSFVEIPEHYATQKTNERLLQAMFGPDPNALPGKRVTFVPDKDKFGKDLVDAIRISGSPDLAEPMTVVVTYPARTGRPDKTFTLRPTRAAEATRQEQQQEDDYPIARLLEQLTQAATMADARTLANAANVPKQHRKAVGDALASRSDAGVTKGDDQ